MEEAGGAGDHAVQTHGVGVAAGAVAEESAGSAESGAEDGVSEVSVEELDGVGLGSSWRHGRIVTPGVTVVKGKEDQECHELVTDRV